VFVQLHRSHVVQVSFVADERHVRQISRAKRTADQSVPVLKILKALIVCDVVALWGERRARKGQACNTCRNDQAIAGEKFCQIDHSRAKQYERRRYSCLSSCYLWIVHRCPTLAAPRGYPLRNGISRHIFGVMGKFLRS
jgi:hypothetical protein